MNCKICNFKNNFDANFCGNCGAIMQTNNENNTQQSQSTPQISVYTPTQSAWIFAKAIGFIIALQFAIAIFVIVFSIGTDTNILESMLVNLVIMILIQVMFFVAVLSSGTSKFRLIKQRLYISPKLLLIAISMWIIAFISFLSTNVYFGIFLESIGYTSTALVFSTPLEFFLGLLVICFIAPITEELVFRFGILEGFKNKGGVKAVLISSFAFAMMHMNPEQTFYQFLLGVVCGIATFKSNSIIPAIIIHACNNLFSFLITDWVWFNEILVYLFSQGWFV
ncbi:MAG: CPBP family intramembrane metalloprotease, partial [Firmicutes bacterium]|nr:CPBP family intramembrane metalloprotease [Bacillota bacterium]